MVLLVIFGLYFRLGRGFVFFTAGTGAVWINSGWTSGTETTSTDSWLVMVCVAIPSVKPFIILSSSLFWDSKTVMRSLMYLMASFRISALLNFLSGGWVGTNRLKSEKAPFTFCCLHLSRLLVKTLLTTFLTGGCPSPFDTSREMKGQSVWWSKPDRNSPVVIFFLLLDSLRDIFVLIAEVTLSELKSEGILMFHKCGGGGITWWSSASGEFEWDKLSSPGKKEIRKVKWWSFSCSHLEMVTSDGDGWTDRQQKTSAWHDFMKHQCSTHLIFHQSH